MHSYSNLWEEFISMENIRKSIHGAIKGKSDRRLVKRIIDDANNFRSKKHDKVVIIDGPNGKKREIIVPNIDEHIIHHMIVNTLKKMFMRGMYDHTYSSIPGRGLHMCRKKVAKWIKNDPKNTKYCLKMDIKKFFNNIDHDVLLKKFRKYIKDKKMLAILEEVLNATDKGIPLGFYTSHWFANWLLQPLDHYIKEELHAAHYVRYMDDMIIFGSNKKKLQRMLRKIKDWLKENKLRLKENYQVFPISEKNWDGKKEHGRPLDFIGFKFYRNTTILRKSLLHRFTRKAKKVARKGKFTIHDAHQMMSYLGWIDWSDTYNVYRKYIAPSVKFKECRKRISEFDRKENEAYRKLEKALGEVA